MGSEMDLKPYLSSLSAEERESLAKRCDTSVGHLVNVSNGKTCGPKLATALEQETKKVTRQEMRPDDYWLIWPDLPAPRKQKARA
jgi:DNA-binding transcriptional regulator YdaS (Cro superfamily)